MPPPLPEDESEVEDIEIPVRKRSADDADSESAKPAKNAPIGVKDMPGASDMEEDAEEDEEGDEGDEGDEEEDVYVIEAIRKHMLDEDGTLKFQVKWEGYDRKSDLTWEPEDSLREDAEEVLENYLESVGGREAIFEQSEKAAKGKKRGRQPSAASSVPAKRSRKNGVHPADTPAPATSKKWAPPAGSWEDLVENIEASQDELTGKLMVYLTWKNGQKTKHETQIVHKKLPQKMLQYYERHIRIVPGDSKNESD